MDNLSIYDKKSNNSKSESVSTKINQNNKNQLRYIFYNKEEQNLYSVDIRKHRKTTSPFKKSESELRNLSQKLPSIGPIKFNFNPVEENNVEIKQLETINRLSKPLVKRVEKRVALYHERPKWNYFYHSYRL